MTKAAKSIADKFLQCAGRYSAPELFTDWVKLYSLSFANIIHGPAHEEREDLFRSIYDKHDKKTMTMFYETFAMLIDAMYHEMSDYLGDIYMAIGQASSLAGQFFTPFHLSELTAKLGTTEEVEYPVIMNEPACGSGGLIIAAAKALKDKGIDYQRYMKVVAQDLDSRCVAMCHVQLSLYGIDAIVVSGSTLTDPYVKGVTDERLIYRTPRNIGVLV